MSIQAGSGIHLGESIIKFSLSFPEYMSISDCINCVHLSQNAKASGKMNVRNAIETKLVAKYPGVKISEITCIRYLDIPLQPEMCDHSDDIESSSDN